MDLKARTDLLIAEYERLADKHKTLVEVRFKLLAFVPAVTGVGVTFLKAGSGTQNASTPTAAAAAAHASAGTQLAVAIFGLIATVGIIMYEVRNSQIHDLAAHMQRELARLLKLPALENPDRRKLFGFITVWHDRALGIVYGACTGAWTGLIAYSGIAYWGAPNPDPSWMRDHQDWVAGLVALLIGWAFYSEIVRINNTTLNDDINKKALKPAASIPQEEAWPELGLADIAGDEKAKASR